MIEPKFKSRQFVSRMLFPKVPFVIPFSVTPTFKSLFSVVLIAKRNSQEQRGNENARCD